MATKPVNAQYAEVAPAVPLPGTGKQTYTYRIPAGISASVSLFSEVKIPLGKRAVKGFVVDVHNRSVRFPTKTLTAPNNAHLTAYQVTFAKWIARTMHGGLGYTLRMFLPPGRLASKAVAVLTNKPTATTALALAVIDRQRERRWNKINRLLAQAVRPGTQILVLVPELWMVEAVMAQLPTTLRALPVHSKLTSKQLTSTWHDVQRGAVDIIVGTQKALYLPYQRLGAVVIEEESFHSHKLWDAYPRLDGRYAARQLAAIHEAPVLYSSAFASTFLAHGLTVASIIPMHNKPLQVMPQVVDASFTDRQHKWTVPSEALGLIQKWLGIGERVLLVLHKHDSAVRYTLHQRFDKYMQKIDARTRELDADARLLVSTTAAFTLLKDERVDRVLLLYPEKPMGYPDYRAEEEQVLLIARLQQLLAPRRRVCVVTRAPLLVQERLLPNLEHNFALTLAERKALHYPPFTALVRLTVAAKTAKEALKRAGIVRDQLAGKLTRDVTLRGPFIDKGKQTKKAEAQLLLAGPLDAMIPLYADLAITNADLAPERIL